MIDCSITENYLAEENRMLDAITEKNAFPIIKIRQFIESKPKEKVATVQEWSNAHPQKTMREKFFEMFPDAPKQSDETPGCCPRQLGWEEQCDEECKNCWDRPYIEKERAE